MRRATCCSVKLNGCLTASLAKACAQASQRRQPPETFRRWDADSELPRCPLLPETPHDDALTLILRLRAEAAFHLDRYEDVRTIAARFGHRYKHLENLLKEIDR